jgi:hypothetical protein
MRRKVDQIRDYLYGGGYPDPLTNAEQLSFLFFILHGRSHRQRQSASGQGHRPRL